MSSFWKAGAVLFDSGSPSFRFYLFVRIAAHTMDGAAKRIAAAIRFS